MYIVWVEILVRTSGKALCLFSLKKVPMLHNIAFFSLQKFAYEIEMQCYWKIEIKLMLASFEMSLGKHAIKYVRRYSHLISTQTISQLFLYVVFLAISHPMNASNVSWNLVFSRQKQNRYHGNFESDENSTRWKLELITHSKNSLFQFHIRLNATK